MKKLGIGYRITAGLIITALLTAGLSVLLFYRLTESAFNDYTKQNRIRQGQELSGFLGRVYDIGGWDGLKTFMQEAAYTKKGHGQWSGMMRRNPPMGQNMFKATPMAQSHIVVTDTQGGIITSTADINPDSPLPASLWDVRVPIFTSKGSIGYVMVWTPPRPDTKSLESIFSHSIFNYSFLSGFFGLCIALVTGILISGQLVKPIKKLSQTVQLFAMGDRDVRIPINTDDELGGLARDFNRLADRIKQSEILKKNLTADVAHELRTPLSIMRGTIESVQAGVLYPTPDVMMSLQDETIRMSRLVKDLFELSRAEAGNLELSREKVAPSSLRDKFSYFKTEAEIRGIQFHVNIPDDLPEIHIDTDRIVQVIINLLNNALKNTASGKIILSAKKAEKGVVFYVKDTGKGIKSEDLPYVFERFYRAEKSRSRSTGGTGLGLSIAKSLVEAHGGSIWAESADEKGTVFSFFLPIERDFIQ